MNTNTTEPTSGRQSWVGVLTRGPQVITSSRQQVAVTILIMVGAVLSVISGVIHLYLWGEPDGYRQIPTIGPLFLAQGISAIIIGLAAAVTRRLAAVLTAAGLLAATAAGLVITIEHGMFGFRETWSAPFASMSAYEEIAGALLLLIASWPLARSQGRHTRTRSPVR